MLFLCINILALIIGLTYLFVILQNIGGGNLKENYLKAFYITMLVLIFCGISLPIILAFNEFTFEKFVSQINENLGDTIGGITSPFVGLLGSFLVYLGFKAQIDANKKIQSQIDSENFNQSMDKIISIIIQDIKEFRLVDDRIKVNAPATGKESIHNLINSLFYLKDVYIINLYSLKTLMKTIEDILIELENNKSKSVYKNLITYQYSSNFELAFDGGNWVEFIFPIIENYRSSLSVNDSDAIAKCEIADSIIKVHQNIIKIIYA